MDIQKLNDLLVPFKIEIVCDNCTNRLDSIPKFPVDFPEPPSHPDNSQSTKKMTQKSPKTYRVFSNSKNHRQRNDFNCLLDPSQAHRRPDPTHPTSHFPSQPSQHHLPRKPSLTNPPNLFLNLNSSAKDSTRRLSIQELLESSRNTPHKIEDVGPERFMYSERKGVNASNNYVNTTAQQLNFCPDESPISYRGKFKGRQPETPVYDRMALGAGPSRDTSPFRPVYHRGSETPSYVDQTPKHYLQFTPNMRGIDPNDEGVNEPFNLLENPFERAL